MKVSDHMDITNYAVDLYWMFSPTELADKFKFNVDDIQEGARSIRNGALDAGARNLHYFNHNNRFEPKKVKLFGAFHIYTLYPTAEHILKKYVQELSRNISEGISKYTFILIGKILHLVQDMSSPAHVIPVYHSHKMRDSFEVRLNSRMGFYLSNFNINQDRFNRVCEPTSNDMCIEHIYRNAALTTLERIHKSNSEFRVEINGESRRVGWDLFWKYDEQSDIGFCKKREIKIDGFGCYGPLGKFFGKEQIQVRNNKYKVNNSVYDDLCNYVVRKSIEDSLRVLVCVDNQIRQS